MDKQVVAWTAMALAAALSCAPATVRAEEPAQSGLQETPEQRDARLAWWREARFGMFIHWGPVSLKGTEIGWSRGGERRGTGGTGQIPVEVYDNLYKQFDPTKFDADEWVAIAKAAGMKYLVFTSRHHDGFSMFATKQSDYNIMNSPFKRDVVGELAQACHEGGLRFGLYYSPPDWHHPDYRTENHQRFLEYLHGQIRELLTNYGKVDVMWFDRLGGTAKDWDSPALFKRIRELQPEIIINDRAGLPADFGTPEQRIGGFQNNRPWETCMTICNQWAWKPDDQMKPLKQCLQTLIRCAGGDGNLLFNVGPMPTGEIEPRQVDRLKELGAWLQQYGESVYGTRGGPFKPATSYTSSHKGNTVYLHVFDWIGDSLELPPLPKKIVSSTVLTGGTVELRQTGEGITLSVPAADRQEIDTLIRLELDGPAGDIPPVVAATGSVAAGKDATASNIFQKMADYGPDKALDDDRGTRWATDGGTKQAWLEVDLGKPVELAYALINEWATRVQSFELQVKRGDQWETIASGATIGDSLQLDFPPVTAQVVRLNILEATEGPTIEEFQLYPPKKK